LHAVACISVGPSVSPASLPQRRDRAQSHLMISASRPSGTDATRSRLPCHPPSWLGAASHTCFQYTGVRKNLCHNLALSLPAWSSKRERCCCISAASLPEPCAPGPRTCLSRLALAVYRGLDFIISKWASYFSCRSLICNPLMSVSHCSKVASDEPRK
jgi:hypothetical protein